MITRLLGTAIFITVTSCTSLPGGIGTVRLDPGQRPEEGVTYEFVVPSHCGIWEINVGGNTWTPSNIERGSSPEGTDPISTSGTIRLEQRGTLVFRATGGLIVEFVRAPEGLPPVPPCD